MIEGEFSNKSTRVLHCFRPAHPRFGAHGASLRRLDFLASGPCRCHRGDCFQQINVMKDLLLQFLKLLWDMAKHIQDEYLRVTLKTEGEKPRKTWFLLGKRFGPKCCLAVLGIGNSRVSRVEAGRFDRRFGVWGGVTWWQKELYIFTFHPIKYQIKCSTFVIFKFHAIGVKQSVQCALLRQTRKLQWRHA